MLAEDLEDTVVLVFLQGCDIGRLRFGFTAGEHQLTTTFGVGTQVEFSDVDVFHELRETADGFVELLLVGEIDVIVSLHTDTIDGHTSVLHLLYHIIDTFALAGIHGAVIVVEQLYIRISLTGKLESLGDELVATKLESSALAIGAGIRTEHHVIIGNGLVHHVPGIDDVLVTGYYCMDMVAQTLVEHFFLHRLAFLVLEHPVGKLCMPAEVMSTELDAVLAAEVCDAIGSAEVPYAFCRVHLAYLHVVLGSDAVELLLDKGNLLRDLDVVLVDGYSNGEVVLIGIFHT